MIIMIIVVSSIHSSNLLVFILIFKSQATSGLVISVLAENIRIIVCMDTQDTQILSLI